MEVRVLGPLEVRAGERPLPLGGAKQRALLALLVLHRNEVVSTDRIVDDLWGGRPPATVAKAIQVYVSRLRKLLGPDRILTQPPGYRLVAGPEDVDLDRFERLRERASGADARSASELLRAALALWRGGPFADLAYEPFLQPELARLGELWVLTVEDRVDVDLHAGRHAELVGELEELVERHPLRERLRGQLMIALYRSGRQADALGAFRDARSTLVDELGIEPGAELRALHERILAQDPGLEPAVEAPPPRTAASPAEPHGERRLISVVAVEIAQDDADPERLRAILREHEAAVAAELEAAGARVEWRAAGGVLATIGAGASLEDHAARALHAALAVRERLGHAVRIGVDTGEVVVEAEGVTGPPVASARRLASGAATAQVLSSPRTVGASGGGVRVEPGAAGLVVTASCEPGHRRARRRFGRSFVGRESELAVLAATFERCARECRAHVVTIVGDAGVGKTSVLEALRGRVGDTAAWHVGRCAAYGRAVTYRAVGEIVRSRYGIADPEPAESVRSRLGDREILALSLGLPAPAGLHPFRARELLRDAWVDLLQELAEEGPAVVVVEDLHWADEALFELIDRAGRDVGGPLLLLATARPEAELHAGRRDATRVWLEPLDRRDAERMVRAVAGELPDAVIAAVVERAEGNPFFVEEVLEALVDDGILTPEGDGWSAGTLPRRLPAGDNVQSVIASRIDRLPADERAVLQAAAVAGRSFWRGSVAELLDRPATDLDVLEERDFVRRVPRSSVAGDREFAFKHALTREVALGSLAAPRRAHLHAAFAGWLERAGDPDEHAALIAHHYAEALATAAWEDRPDHVAVLRRSAARWLRRAAELAVGRYELADAAALFEQAAGFAGDDLSRAELLRGAAHAHVHRFDLDAFRATMERAIALAGSGPEAASLLAELAVEGAQPFLWRRPPRREDVVGWSERALADAGDARTRALALLAGAFLDPARGEPHADAAIPLCERLQTPTLLGKAYEAKAFCCTATGRLADAKAWSDRAMAQAPAMDDPDRRTGRLFYGVFAYLRAGDVAGALRIAAEHDELATRLTPHHEVHSVAARLLAETIAGRWDEAAALRDRMERAAGENLDTPCQFNWRALLVSAHAAQVAGAGGEARRLEERAAEIAALGGPLTREPALLRLALARSDLAEAARILAADPGPDTWDVDYGAARLDGLVAIGDHDTAEREAEAAIALGGYAAPFGLRALGRVRGDRALLERAAVAFDDIGLAWRACETRAAPPVGGAARAASRRAAR